MRAPASKIIFWAWYFPLVRSKTRHTINLSSVKWSVGSMSWWTELFCYLQCHLVCVSPRNFPESKIPLSCNSFFSRVLTLHHHWKVYSVTNERRTKFYAILVKPEVCNMHVSKLILLIVLSWVNPGNLSGIIVFSTLESFCSVAVSRGGLSEGYLY